MYAARKEWPLEHVTVNLQHEKLSADDPSLTPEERAHPTADGRVDVIRLSLGLRRDLTADQVQRLQEIAARCPMRRTLLATPKVIESVATVA